MQQYWYWISGIADGRPFRAGPYDDNPQGYSKANADGIKFCGSNFRLYKLTTRDKSEAGSQIKYQLADGGMPINDALQRQRINKPNKEASQVYKEQNERQYREL